MKCYENKVIVITGAAGFIGSGTVAYLNEQGLTNLILIDTLDTSEKWKNLVGKQFLELIPIEEIFPYLQTHEKAIGAIIHLGAITDTTTKDMQALLENNTRFSQNLAHFALSRKIRFIYASSAATYGLGERGFSDDHSLLDTLRPLNPYALSKHLFDLWLLRHQLLNKVVGLKYFNVFGPNENHKGRMASLIYHILPQALNKGVVHLFKSTDQASFPDGEQCRDFIYVKEAARLTTAFLDNEACGLYNVGSGLATTWNALALAVFKAIQKPPRIEYIDMPFELVSQYQNYTCADMTKTKELLKEEVTMAPFETSVIEYVRNYLLPNTRW